MENGGIFVAKARHLSLAGSMTSNTQSFIPMSPRVQQSPQHGQQGGGKTPWGGQVQKSQRDVKILGKTVRIIKGPYKGLSLAILRKVNLFSKNDIFDIFNCIQTEQLL